MRRSDRRLASAEAVADRALAAAAGPCIVIVHDASSAEVRFANNTTTTNGRRRDRLVSVICFDHRRDGVAVGVASASGAVDVAPLVERARADAVTAPPAEDAAELYGGSRAADFDAEPVETDLRVFASVLEDLKEAFVRARAEGHVLSGFATHEVETVYLASSTGLRQRYVEPSGTLEVVARSGDGARSAWVGRATSDFTDCSLAGMEQQALERLSWAKRRIELPAGRYETILPPDAVADLMIVAYEAASGREAEDGHNVFSAPGGRTRIGERISDLPFVLESDPNAPGMSCAPILALDASSADASVFDNGAPLRATRWIDGGLLARLRYHRAGARRSEQPFSPPIDNLRLELSSANASLAELIASTRRGLLLTCLWYIRELDLSTLLLTGLTRDGVYLVEDGEVVGAVNNFRFNESPIDLLARSAEASMTERALSREWGEWMPRTAMPALRVLDFNMSSVSPAS